MKTLQITLAGGVIIAAIFTGSYLMTDNLKINDLQNVGIVDPSGVTINNAGSAADVAANYPILKNELEAAVVEFKKENVPVIVSAKFTLEDRTVIIESEIKGEATIIVEGTDGGDWVPLYKTGDLASPIKLQIEPDITMIRFYAENQFGKSDLSEEFSTVK